MAITTKDAGIERVDSIEHAMNMAIRKYHDPVSHPKHYTQGGIECIDAMEAALTPEEFRGYLKGQIMKYNWRLGLKDTPVQEVGKLQWYAERLRKFFVKQEGK